MAEGGDVYKELWGRKKSFLKTCTCSNPSCGIKTECRVAPFFVRVYFDFVKPRNMKKRKRVCTKCYTEAENHNKIVVEKLKKGESLLRLKRKHENDVVTIDDDSSEDSEESGEEVDINHDFEEVLNSLIVKYNIKEQFAAAAAERKKEWSETKKEISKLENSIDELQETVNQIDKDFYGMFEVKIREIESIDIDMEGNVSKHSTCPKFSEVSVLHPSTTQKVNLPLPPLGKFKHHPLRVDHAVFAMRNNTLLASWGKGRVTKVTRDQSGNWYNISFDSHRENPCRLPLKFLAYVASNPFQFAVGDRVIAQYNEEKNSNFEPNAYYAAVVAEAPKHGNQNRYLVFFDQGYAQYCSHEQMRMVCYSSKEVSHDVYENSRPYIARYLKSYPERAMVKLQVGQRTIAELEGAWCHCLVDSLDVSLVRIRFLEKNRYEWIYRGSTRLRPLYDMLIKEKNSRKLGARRPTHDMALVHKKKNAPYVVYTHGDLDASPPPESPSTSISSSSESYISSEDGPQIPKQSSKKSPSNIRPLSSTPSRQENSEKGIEHKGQLIDRPNDMHQTFDFSPHQCGTKCIKGFPYESEDSKNENPLSIPMLLWGWARKVFKKRKAEQEIVVYRAPCGRMLRNMDEVHRYLRLTRSQLGVDLFSFDSCVNCFREFVPYITYDCIPDITNGCENVPISCVNSIDDSVAPNVDYSTKCIPRPGVNINMEPGFLVCCDCTDDCQDKENCQCWQLTINRQSIDQGAGGKINENVGYEYRRLQQIVYPGIYECNDNCKCKARQTCLNRVAQWPLQLRLQLFKTEKRGWGIRCLDDIAGGQFICVYTGEVWNNKEADEMGKQFGDEYFAELDLIEIAERYKDGYESQAYDTDWENSSSENESDGNSDSSNQFKKKRKKRSSQQREKSYNANISTLTNSTEEGDSQKTRLLFDDEEEGGYIIDAKTKGNIGRYINHSCEPNIFVQNVFVDTHDLRFPWVGFFAQSYIRAGTELTWDYSYQVGSVPNKQLDCYCGAKGCRGRLL